MLKKNPLTEDEHVRVASLMREIDDLSKRGRLYASTGGAVPETLRKTARAYNDRVAVLRVLIGNRPVERLEQKWLYGPVAWTMVVGQEWNAVVQKAGVPIRRGIHGIACNPSTCRNPKHHHAARKNTDIAGAMIAGASAAIVGRMIRGNPVKWVPLTNTHRYPGRIGRLAEMLKREGIPSRISGNVIMVRAGRDLDRGVGVLYRFDPQLERQNPVTHQNFRHARIRRRPKPGECEIGLVSQDNCYRKATVDVEMGLKRGTPLRVCQRHADWIKRMKGNPRGTRRNPGDCERLEAQAQRVRLWEKLYSQYTEKLRRLDDLKKAGRYGYQLRMPLKALKIAADKLKEVFPEETKRMRLNPAPRKRYSPPRDRAKMFEVFWMSGKQAWHAGPFFGRPGAEKYVERYKAGWKGTWPLHYYIMSYKQWGESGAPTSAPEWIRAWQTNSRSKHRPSGRHCTSCGTPLKRGETLMCAFCRREGSYSFNKRNPLASGGWRGWDIRTDRGGFIKRLGKSVVVHVYLNKGPAPNIWTWRIIRAGKRVAGGDVPTDEIARRRALAALRGTHKNPDELTGTMIVKCSTCKCVIRTEPCIQEFDGKISHGFCPTHQAEERAKVEAWIASRKAARNPSGNLPSKKEMATWPKCVTCGKPAGFSVDWLYPQRVPDERPCCSSRCAVAAVKKGRPASNPSSKIPMYQIRNWVGKFHVGTSNQQIEAALKAQIAKSKDPRWTPVTIRQAVAVALKAHNANRTQYRQVMRGRF